MTGALQQRSLDSRGAELLNKSVRALHIQSGNIFGGIETILTTLARHQRLYPPLVSSFALCFAGRLSTEVLAAGARLTRLPPVRVRRPWTIVQARRALKDLFSSDVADVAVCHSPWALAIFGPVAQRAGIPTILWLHGPVNAKHWLDRWALTVTPDVILCNSQFTKSVLLRQRPDLQAEVAYYPVVASRASNTMRETVRSANGLSPETVVIAQVGRLDPWKGNAAHIEALSGIRDIPNWVSWQIGGGQHRNDQNMLGYLKSLAVKNGLRDRVRFFGERSDVRDLLSAADVYFQPNAGPEPFGVTFIEAMQAGLPILATDLGGAREIVDETCGLRVPLGAGSELADALRRLVQSRELRVALGTAGPRRAAELCGPVRQMEQVYSVCARAIGLAPKLTGSE